MITAIPCDQGRHGACTGHASIRGELKAPYNRHDHSKMVWVTVECECSCHLPSKVKRHEEPAQKGDELAQVIKLPQQCDEPVPDWVAEVKAGLPAFYARRKAEREARTQQETSAAPAQVIRLEPHARRERKRAAKIE